MADDLVREFAHLEEGAGDLGTPRPLVWWGTVMGVIAIGMGLLTYLFAYAYIGIEAPDWPPQGLEPPSPGPFAVATLPLAAAAVAGHLAARAARSGAMVAVQGASLAAALLGAAFVGIVLTGLVGWGADPTAHAYASLVTVGIAAHLALTSSAALGSAVLAANVGDEPVRRHQSAIAFGILWWFTGAMWLVVAPTLLFGHLVIGPTTGT